MISWTNITIDLDSLEPWSENPKSISKASAKRLLDYWGRIGQFQTVAIGPQNGNGKYPVYDGHQRLHVLKAAHGGKFAIDARVSDRALTEDERAEMVVQAHVGTTGQWDWDRIASWDGEMLQTWGMDADLLGQWQTDAGALGVMLESGEEKNAGEDTEPQIDRAEELRKEWGVELGQMWQLGEHRLVCGDCTDKAVVDRVMGGECIDLVVTDPPYSVDYAAKNRALQTIGPSNRLTTDITGDTLSTEETAELVWGPAFENTYGKSRNGTVIYCFSPQGGDQMMMMMMMIKEKWNKRLHQLIWRKNSPTFSMGRLDYQYQHEPILYSWRGTNHGYYGDVGTSVIDFDRPSSSKLHPTMKPIGLIEKLIANSSKLKELVCDPFSGSGTTLIACQNLNRRCRAIEIDPGYVAVTLQRFLDHTGIQPELITQ